jgi:hypothetical protein
MYVILQTAQAPLQVPFCSTALPSPPGGMGWLRTGNNPNFTYNISGVGQSGTSSQNGVYYSVTGIFPSVLKNQKGTLTATNTLNGTYFGGVPYPLTPDIGLNTSSKIVFADYAVDLAATNINLQVTVVDANTGQSYVNPAIAWNFPGHT